jgi:multidrug efflux pump subunit AcrA (membrane-fusion protein)
VIVVLLVLAAIVAAVALAGYLPRKAREEAANAAAHEEMTTLPTVTSALVRRAAGDTDVVLPGDLSPLLESSIYARAAGYVRKRYVDIGDRVTEGQLMAEIDAPELDQQVAQSRAAVSQAEQQLSQSKAALVQAESQRDLAKITAERYNNLVARGAVARQDADTQQSNYKTSEALVAAQQASVQASVENVKQAQANLARVIDLQDFKSVKAPFAGIVTARNIDAGALISATGAGQGASPMSTGGALAANGNEMFRVAQIGTMRILINVPQTNAPGIHTGMPAGVLVNEFPGKTFDGKVTRTANSIDPNSRTLLVEVQVPNRDGKLLPGMYAEVRFRSHRDSPPLMVPGDALIAANAGPQVAVLLDTDSGTAKKIHLQPVQLGRDFGAETEIIAGLQGTESVVVNPGDDVREGAMVKVDSVPAGRGAAKQ